MKRFVCTGLFLCYNLISSRHQARGGFSTRGENLLVYNQAELAAALQEMRSHPETEVVEVKKLTNLLQVMKKKDRTINSAGKTRQTVWFIQNQQI